MALRNIVKVGDDVLRKQCKPQTKFDERLWTLLDDMAETMYATNGVGLAAPQVGILKRVVVIDVGDGLIELINPEIIEATGSEIGVEGCLSVPGKQGLVKRPSYVRVRALDRNGVMQVYEGTDLLARCFCHEIDHLDGHLYVDKATKFLYPDKDGDYYYDED